MDTDTYTDRIRQFCTAFKLPTVGTEAVPRFQQAGTWRGLGNAAGGVGAGSRGPSAAADHSAASRLQVGTG